MMNFIYAIMLLLFPTRVSVGLGGAWPGYTCSVCAQSSELVNPERVQDRESVDTNVLEMERSGVVHCEPAVPVLQRSIDGPLRLRTNQFILNESTGIAHRDVNRSLHVDIGAAVTRHALRNNDLIAHRERSLIHVPMAIQPEIDIVLEHQWLNVGLERPTGEVRRRVTVVHGAVTHECNPGHIMAICDCTLQIPLEPFILWASGCHWVRIPKITHVDPVDTVRVERVVKVAHRSVPQRRATICWRPSCIPAVLSKLRIEVTACVIAMNVRREVVILFMVPNSDLCKTQVCVCVCVRRALIQGNRCHKRIK